MRAKVMCQTSKVVVNAKGLLIDRSELQVLSGSGSNIASGTVVNAGTVFTVVVHCVLCMGCQFVVRCIY